MCAAEASKRGRRVVVLERSAEPGKKILISGGGRCNFTNIHTHPENFLSDNPHFAKSALSRYTPRDFTSLVENHQISYHEKTLGQLFCDRSARDIVDLLLAECGVVDIVTSCRITSVRRTTEFIIETENGAFSSASLVVAAGGLSIPKIGATSLGYDLARQFGLRIVPTRPALVPFTLNDSDARRWCDLAGVATDVIASCGSQSFRERMLITHRGLSGPAILQISSYWDMKRPVVIDLLPDSDLQQEGNKAPKTILSNHVPRRLAERWIELHPALATWTELNDGLHQWEIMPSGTEGYAKAEVTAGGVDTTELSSKTMESRKVPGLYFIGEVVDVTGHLGGFNFQWAWASGVAAGQAV